MENYSAIVLSNCLAESKTNKTPSVRIQVRTEKNVDTGEEKILTLTGDLWLTQNAAPYTCETLDKVFGFSEGSFAALNLPILAGKKCEVAIEYEEYEGQAYPKIKFFNRPGSFRPLEKMDAGHAIAVASSVDAALSAYRLKKGLGKPQTQPQTKQTSTTEADDLPF